MHRHINVHPASVTVARTLSKKCLHLTSVVHQHWTLIFLRGPEISQSTPAIGGLQTTQHRLVDMGLSLSKSLDFEGLPNDLSNQILDSQVNLP
ncbi:hypothetical protein BGHDH14_bgh04915 [Blumeria hordei DH14]|uniref:Uncharacterized protein n=1 Tax=Blumeria graminis f. sp. hordei (strain DH14) TaxID=546991 RepID=N1J6R2_BLUG1|nr:hypothetical protein BGHDH14_bgh04915 [Blumeria hordei DH14]